MSQTVLIDLPVGFQARKLIEWWNILLEHILNYWDFQLIDLLTLMGCNKSNALFLNIMTW